MQVFTQGSGFERLQFWPPENNPNWFSQLFIQMWVSNYKFIYSGSSGLGFKRLKFCFLDNNLNLVSVLFKFKSAIITLFTLVQVLHHLQAIYEAVDSGEFGIRKVFADFTKGFD